MLSTTLLTALSLLRLSSALNPSCAPGGNFPSLINFTLELPIGTSSSPNTPSQIPGQNLTGCNGYQDPGHHYFFTKSGDGALVMKVPGSPEATGCVKYAESKHCRTELREMNPGSWNPNATTNELTVNLAVTVPDDSMYGTCIGQIFMTKDAAPALKPACELYYSQSGVVTIGIEQTRDGGDQVPHKVGNVPVGTPFTYVLAYEKGALSVSVNGKRTTLPTYSLWAPESFFKVGNYNQGQSASDVHFYSIDIRH